MYIEVTYCVHTVFTNRSSIFLLKLEQRFLYRVFLSHHLLSCHELKEIMRYDWWLPALDEKCYSCKDNKHDTCIATLAASSTMQRSLIPRWQWRRNGRGMLSVISFFSLVLPGFPLLPFSRSSLPPSLDSLMYGPFLYIPQCFLVFLLLFSSLPVASSRSPGWHEGNSLTMMLIHCSHWCSTH